MEEIEKIKIKDIRYPKPQSRIINNFFTILTIGMFCFVMLWWANYIRPAQIEYEKKEAKKAAYLKELELKKQQREEEIKRSQIYNSKKTDESTH